jgi:calcineurin-like phosphoesterase family protein
MSIRFWTADPHYNHANIARYTNRPQVKPGDLNPDGSWISPEIAFQRAEEMNTMLTREANQRIKSGDTVICVGDFSCRGGERGVKGLHIKPAEILAKLNGTWTIIGGNHDSQNGVKAACEFMVVEIAKYRVGVQHRPLLDEESYLRWKALSPEERAKSPWRDRMSDRQREREFDHAAYCRRFDFMICGHVHNAWKVRKVAGIWHVNVGVDVNRYMPINDTEVALIYEKAVRGEA